MTCQIYGDRSPHVRNRNRENTTKRVKFIKIFLLLGTLCIYVRFDIFDTLNILFSCVANIGLTLSPANSL